MSSEPEPVIWSHDTGQQIPHFDRCQLAITWMSNIKDICCKPRLHDCMNQLDYGHHVMECHCHWAHAPTISAASHVDHEKQVAWVSISLHACDPVPRVMVLCKCFFRCKFHKSLNCPNRSPLLQIQFLSQISEAYPLAVLH